MQPLLARTLAGIAAALWLVLLAPAGAEELWIIQRLDATPAELPTHGELIAEPLAGGTPVRLPCRILQQGDERWVVGRVDVNLTGDYRLSLATAGSERPIELVARRALSHRQYDVVLLIDRSLSMRQNDPRDLRAEAIRSFVALARRGNGIRNLALIAFDDELHPMQPPTPAREITEIEPLLSKLYPRGSTDFDLPFRAARDLLAEAEGARPAVVFLSDGEPFGDYHDSHRLLAEMGCPIYAIGLSEEADSELLSRVAEESGGSFFAAPRAAQLPAIFTEVFRLISQPVSVYRDTVPVDGTLSRRLLLDADMRNAVLEWATLSGTQQVKLGGKELPAADERAIVEAELGSLPTGVHELTISGSGRATLTVRADADVDLLPIVLNADAPQGLPLRAAVVLRGHASCRNVEVTASLTLPDGTRQPVAVEATELAGLFLLAPAATPLPGPYSLRIEATGQIADAPFLRSTGVMAERRRRSTAASTDMQPSAQLALPTLELPGPAAIDLDATRRTSTHGALRTTFWASAEGLVLDTLYPGGAIARDIEIVLNAPTTEPAELEILGAAGAGIYLQLAGTVRPNQKSVLRLTATADPDAAGKRHQATLRIALGDEHWELPIAVMVGVPRIVIEPLEPDVTDTPKRVSVVQKVRVRLEPEGRVPLQATTDLQRLRVEPASIDAGTAAVPLVLRFGMERPVPQRQWQGSVRLTGPGLEAVELPFELEIKERVALPQVAPIPPRTVDWRLLLWIALALLVIGLVLAAMRGNQRAVFVLASIAVHIAILFLVLPRPEEARDEEQRVTTIQMTSGGVVHEQQIASETAAYEPRDQAPAEQPQELTTAALPEPQPDEAEQLQAPEVEPEIEETADAAEVVEAVPRDALATRLEEEAVAEPASRRAEEAPTHNAPDSPTKAESPRQTVARVELAAPNPLAPGEMAEAVEAPAELTPAELPVQRQAMASTAPLQPEAAPISRRANAGEPSTQAPQQSASPSPDRTVMRIATASPSAFTPAESTAAVAIATELAPPELELGREPLAPATPTPAKPDAQMSARRSAESDSSQGAPRAADADARPGDGSVARAETAVAGALAPASAQQTIATVPALEGDLAAVRPPPGSAELSADEDQPAAPARARVVAAEGAAEAQPAEAGTSSAPGAALQRADGEIAVALATGAAQREVRVAAELQGSTPRVRPAKVAARAPAAAPARAPERIHADGPERSTRAQESGKPAAPAATVAARHGADSQARPLAQALAATPAPLAERPAMQAPPALAAPTAQPREPGDAATPPAATIPSRRKPDPGTTITAAQPAAEPQVQPEPSVQRSDVAPAPMPMALAPTAQLVQSTELQAPTRIGLRQSGTSGTATGSWSNTLPLLRYSGDWDADKTAMINLAHQLERRTGSILPIDSRTIDLTSNELGETPFLFMTGHRDFRLSDEEQQALRRYLAQGGYLWINDSTDLGDEQYDAAVRRELATLFPRAELKPIPMDHPLFSAPYDLRRGYHGYRVPPGDKYRQDYLEGLWIGDRLAVVYTRNDYGDGLEIDPHTHPLMPSLSDLSPAEMQEGSARIGINIALHFMNHGEAPEARLTSRVRSTATADQAAERAWIKHQPLEIAFLDADQQWATPEGWADLIPTTAARDTQERLLMTFDKPDGAVTRRDKAVIGLPLELVLTRQQGIVLDIFSGLSGGARLALAFQGPDGYIESGPVFLRPGMNRDVAFDLSAATFKTEATEWTYEAELGERRGISHIYLILYPQKPAGHIRIDAIRLVPR